MTGRRAALSWWVGALACYIATIVFAGIGWRIWVLALAISVQLCVLGAYELGRFIGYGRGWADAYDATRHNWTVLDVKTYDDWNDDD